MQNKITPNKDQIKQHLQLLFGECRGYDDGKIEIAYTPSDTPAVNKAEFFDALDIEAAAEFAYQKNAQEGVNVYVGAALRSPETAPFGRSSLDDYYASYCVWCDMDDAQAAKTAKDKYKDLPPSFVVVTGREPNLRAQLWWKLQTPEEEKELLKSNLAHICNALDGDPAVVDPARVMRLGGTIAYPKKDGRVIERTELVIPPNPTQMVHINKFASYFTIPENKPQKSHVANNNFKNRITGTFEIEKLLEASREDGKWHCSMRDAICSMVGKGWSDEQIRIATNPYRRDRSLVDDMISPLIYSARNKFNHPEPTEKGINYNPETGEIIEEKSFNILDWIASKTYAGKAPELEWIIEDVLQKNIPALLAAMGGLGKSFTVLDICIEIAKPASISPKRVLGGSIIEHGKCVFFTAEDSKNSIHRRMNAICSPEILQQTKDNLIVIPMPDAGGAQSLIKEGKDGVITTDFYDIIKKQLSGIDNVRLIVFDPLQAFVGADITSKPENAQYMWTALAHLASVCNASVLCTHHMRKDGLKSIKTLADAREAIRGTTAIIDGCRMVYSMWQADAETGKEIAKEHDLEYSPENFVLGGIVKSNDNETREITTFIRQENGVLKDYGSLKIDHTDLGLTLEQCKQSLREVSMAWDSGKPFGRAHNSLRPLTKWLSKTFKITNKAAKAQIDNWLNPSGSDNPIIEERTYFGDNKRPKTGLYVNRIY